MAMEARNTSQLYRLLGRIASCCPSRFETGDTKPAGVIATLTKHYSLIHFSLWQDSCEHHHDWVSAESFQPSTSSNLHPDFKAERTTHGNIPTANISPSAPEN